jgi:hypothetical protein
MNPDPASLDRLHDIIVPPSVPWWPPAPAWYWMLSLVLVLFVVFILKMLRVWQRNRYRREALAQHRKLTVLLGDAAAGGPAARLRALADLAELIKRAALSAYPREAVASLTGDCWLDFLNRTGQTVAFSSNPGNFLARISYEASLAGRLDGLQIRALCVLTRDWLRQHRANPRSN